MLGGSAGSGKSGVAGLNIDLDALSGAIMFIFSWVILLPIGVIVTGKLLSQRMKLQVGTGQLIRIPVSGVLTVQATGPEVILGFALYLMLLLCLGTLVGAHVEDWVQYHFGIKPGQFNALGFVTSLGSVTLSSVVFLITQVPANSAQAKRLKRHDEIVEKLTMRQTGIDPRTLDQVDES